MHLFKRLHKRLGIGWGWQRHQSKHRKNCDTLAQAQADYTVTIICNNDHKTVERGLYTGVSVKVLRNEADEPNLIVAVGDARYVLDRRIAHKIKVTNTKTLLSGHT